MSRKPFLLAVAVLSAAASTLSAPPRKPPAHRKPIQRQQSSKLAKPLSKLQATAARLDGKIIFGQQHSLYAISPTGGRKTRIFENAHGSGWFASISPDGQKVLYTNEGNVFLLDITGKQLKKFSVGGSPVEARFSPDGTTAICSSASSGSGIPHDGAYGTLFLLNLTIGKQTFVLKRGKPPASGQAQVGDADFNEHSPSWSPDGKHIVFVGGGFLYGDAKMAQEIYVLNVESGKTTRLTHDFAIDLMPAFSLDGTQIVWSRVTSEEDELWLMNADGSNPHRLSAQPGEWPSFSPDGKHILFSKDSSIRVLNSDGSVAHLLDVGHDSEQWPDCSHPQWFKLRP